MGASQEFTWSEPGSTVNEWWVYIGSSAGSADIEDSGTLGTATGYTATNLPTDGSTVNVRLFYRESAGTWQWIDASYMAVN